MAQATHWVLPHDDFFSTLANPSKFYWMCPPYHRFSDCVRKIRQEKLLAIVLGPKWTHREWWKPLMEITLQGYHHAGPKTKARLYQDDNLTPLPQQGWSRVALYVDGGITEENLVATKCRVASILAPAVPNPDTDDEPGMTSVEESQDERVPNHLASVRTLTYQATHKKLLAPVTLDPGPNKNACVHALQKLKKCYRAGGPLPLSATERLTAPSDCLRRRGLVALSPPKNLLCVRRSSS